MSIYVTVFPQEVDVAVNGILPVAYATKGLVMQPIVQCLGDGKPYKEGAGSFVLIPDNSTNSGGNTAGGKGNAGTALAVGSSTWIVGTSIALAAVAGVY